MVTGSDKVRVSVAMAAYNGEAYLESQLDSILAQLKEQDEVVVSDDGSRDATLAILTEYQKKDPRIRLVQGPGQGIKKNVECALKHTRGVYIFLADQDDIWLPGKVERVLECFREQSVFVVIHDAQVFAGDDNRKMIMESFFQFRGAGPGVLKNIVKNSYIGCCMAIRRELLPVICPIPDKIEMHDQWIGILGDYYAGNSYFLREPLLLYRRHGDNSSSMTHYGLVRMMRNRVVFFIQFWRRILHIRQKKTGIWGKFKKNDG